MICLFNKYKIIFILFLGFILFNNNGVFAESNYNFYTDYFTTNDINSAKNKLGSIWEDENYDIFLSYKPGWDSNGTKSVVYFDISNISNSVDFKYVLNISGSVYHNNLGSWYGHSCYLVNINGEDFSISSHYEKSILNNNWSDTLGNDSSNGRRWISNFNTKDSASSSAIYCFPIRTHYNIYDSDGNLLSPATHPIAEPKFNLEYNSSTDSYFVYSNWYDYIDNYEEGIYHNTWYRYNHFYQCNPEHTPIFFNVDLREQQGWLNMEGYENDLGDIEFNHTEDFTEIPDDLKWRDKFEINEYGDFYFCWYDRKLNIYQIQKFTILANGSAYTEIYNDSNNSWVRSYRIRWFFYFY